MIIDAVLNPAEIDLLPQRDLSESVCVVFDVLRATSCMITGLAHNVDAILPVITIEDALAAKATYPDVVLGGERFGNRIEGFNIGNSPREYMAEGINRVVTTTTNGTVALKACSGAKEVLTGALLNIGSLQRYLAKQSPSRLVLVCAGTFRDLALEDVLAAGMLASLFPEASLTDSAQVALSTYQCHGGDLKSALRSATNGRKLIADGREGDVDWCSQISKYDVIGSMSNGWITRLAV
jgi:2-phosphosulfolactate phosphatase